MRDFDIEGIKKYLEDLKKLPNFKEVVALRNRLQSEINRNIKKPKQEKKISINQKRSGKLKRYHNYIRQIRNNFPDLSYNQIRSQLKKRKKGFHTEIPDAIWQNPSP